MATVSRTWLLVALGVLVVASASATSITATTPEGQPRPAAPVSMTLYGSASTGWGRGPTNITSPGPTLTVNQGDVITFTLFAQDGVAHTLVIDLNSDGTRDSGEPESGQFTSSTTAVTFTYTANTAGTIQYYCGTHGTNPMRGTLTVRAAGGPTGDNTLLIVGGVVLVVVIAAAAAAMRMRKKAKPPTQPPTQ